MNDNFIIFREDFDKLRKCENLEEVTLLECVNVHRQDLSRAFINYDTEGIFPLPTSGRYILLIFQCKQSGHVFTTLRKHTLEKERHYKTRTGQKFRVQVKPPKKKLQEPSNDLLGTEF